MKGNGAAGNGDRRLKPTENEVVFGSGGRGEQNFDEEAFRVILEGYDRVFLSLNGGGLMDEVSSVSREGC